MMIFIDIKDKVLEFFFEIERCFINIVNIIE